MSHAPRLLGAEQACAYLGLKSREGLNSVPVRPVRIGARVLWDVRALDAWLDQLAGLSPSAPSAARPSSPAGDDDPDAALAAWMQENGTPGETAGRA